jgi:hypothetical protein
MKTKKRGIMKTVILLAAIGLFSIQLNAQSMTRNATTTTFGLRTGVNFQTLNGKDATGNSLENNINTGFHAGFNAEIPVGTGSYLQPGILYSRKGAEFQSGSRDEVKLNYIEVPVNFVYKPLVGMGNMVLGFGPYVAYAIGGNVEQAGSERNIDFDAAYNANDVATQFKKFDAGGNLLAGYEFANRMSLQLNAQLGLVNINKDNPTHADDQTKWRNTGFGLSVGYRF